MAQDQRPHSREKTVASGTVGVHTGHQVQTGGRPVGAGGRGGSGAGRSAAPSSSRPAMRAPGGAQMRIPMGGGALRSGGKLKKLLLLVVAVIVIVVVLKSVLGGLGGVESDYGTDLNANSYTPTTNSASGPSSSGGSGADHSVSPKARAKRVTPVGNGEDVVTVMVYMCGTDLESKYGMATSDLQEMLNATISDQVNLIVETGGCSKWKNSTVSAEKNQIYQVMDDGMKLLEADVGNAAMTDPKNLTSFIRYCTENFPADRSVLIFWDHGGGSLSGYGYDEKHPNSSSMTLSGIDSALKAADCTFDWIGFDACLMATLETSLVCNDYADYMLASEETEPGTGWQYTGWLTALSKNTSIPTVELAQTVIDDFVTASCASSRNAQVTLSVIDLAELQGTVPDAFRSFASSTNELLHSDSYQRVSDARAGVRQFAQSSKINQVDLVDLALRMDTEESRALAQALQSCVKYNRSTISRSYGVSIFFPYESTKSVKNAVSSYQAIGIDDEYTKCIQSFASLEYGGQIAASASQTPASQSGSAAGGDLLGTLLSAYAGGGSTSSPLGALLGSFTGSSGSAAAGLSIDPSQVLSLLSGFSGRSMPQEQDWVDTELIASQAELIAQQFVNPAHLTPSVKNGRSVLSLTDEEWNLIQTIELNVFAEDGGGYVDLGLDNTFNFDGADLLLDYDGTWLTLNGHVCAYYLVSDAEQEDGSWTTVGRIPALLNGEAVNLQVVFDGETPEGAITGAYPLYDGETDVQAKGDIAVQPGDTIELLCDYYDLNGDYSASYTLGSAFEVPDDGLVLRNQLIDTQGVSVTYRVSDIYGNHYWVPVED